MKTEMIKQMYKQYISNVKKVRNEHIDIPPEQILKKKGKKK